MSSDHSDESRRLRILIADDEPNIRLLYQNELEAEGYEVILAEDGREAVEKVDSENPDLVVLDIRMPGMDGIEALGRILDRHRTLPVILNTAYSTYEDDFMTWSADAYIVKSADVGVLMAKIAEVLGKRRGGDGQPPEERGEA